MQEASLFVGVYVHHLGTILSIWVIVGETNVWGSTVCENKAFVGNYACECTAFRLLRVVITGGLEDMLQGLRIRYPKSVVLRL